MIEGSLFVENMSGNGGALRLYSGLEAAVVRNCVFARNVATNGFGGAINTSGPGEIEGCTFWGNSQSSSLYGGAAVRASDLLLTRNVFSASSGSEAVFTTSLNPNGGCNDYWGNTQGNLAEGLEPYPTDLFVDPQFCDPNMNDWTLAKGSPCLPEGSGTCGQIGALGQGCQTESVEAFSWGRIKDLYR
jgi:predicted outer membrane repeat protein